MITDDQVAQIVGKVNKLVADKADADAKTTASNTADASAKAADAVAAQAKLDEQTADSLTTADLTDLSSFLDSLVAPPIPA